MQPESSANLDTATTALSASSQQPTIQHGLHDHSILVSLSVAEYDGAGTTTPTGAERADLDAALVASLQDSPGGGPNGQRRLSRKDTPSPPVRNRVAEYEQASTPPHRRRERPAFEVVKKQRSPHDTSSPIQDLPNGECLATSGGRRTPD